MEASAALVNRTERQPRATDAELRMAFAVLARYAGNVKRASEELGMPRTTLALWRNSQPRLYSEIAEKLANDLERWLITDQREVSLSAVRAAQAAIKLEHERILAGDVRDASSSAKNLMVASGVSTDKTLVLEHRPTSIALVASTEEDLRFLRSRAIPDAVVVESEPS